MGSLSIYLGLSLVGDVGLVAAVGVDGVGDPLDAAVGQGHVVGATCHVTVPLLVLPKVVVRVIVLHRPAVLSDGFYDTKPFAAGYILLSLTSHMGSSINNAHTDSVLLRNKKCGKGDCMI